MAGRLSRRDKALTVAFSVIKPNSRGILHKSTHIYVINERMYQFKTPPVPTAANCRNMGEEKRRKRREEEIVETALAAAGATLLVSGVKKILACVDIEWSGSLVATPPLLLFLLLHVIIASIVITSTTQPGLHRNRYCRRGDGTRKMSTEKKRKKEANLRMEEEEGGDDHQEERGGDDAEDLNARAEAFIAAFRRQLRVDSLGSRGTRAEACYCS